MSASAITNFHPQKHAWDTALSAMQQAFKDGGHEQSWVELIALFALKFTSEIGGIRRSNSQGNASTRPGLWQGIGSGAWNVGAGHIASRILALARDVELEYSALEGVLTRALLGGLNQLPDELLLSAVRYLNIYNFNTEDPLEFGNWFDQTISSALFTSRVSSGEFTTSASVAHLMLTLAEVESENRILDPCCGIGTVLATAGKMCGNPDRAQLYGQEINIRSWGLCKLRLFLLGFRVDNILLGDSIKHPTFTKHNGLQHFDRVLCDPPLGGYFSNDELRAADLPNRFKFGMPGKGLISSAFIQHVVESLNDTGKGVVLISHSFLFRSGQDARIREGLVKSGAIVAIVGLPRNLRANAAIETALLVLRRGEQFAPIFFVDASGAQIPERGKTELNDQTIEDLRLLFAAPMEKEHLSRFVSLSEIEANDFSLLPQHYISVPDMPRPDLNALRLDLMQAEREETEIVEEWKSLFDRLWLLK